MPRPSLLSQQSSQQKDFSYPARPVIPQLINGRLVGYLDNPETFLTKAWNINDVVFSIVNLIMDKCRVAPWGIYEVVDEQAYKSLQGMQRQKKWSQLDYVKAAALQKKALQPAKNPGKWGELIKYPNQYDTFNDLAANGIGYECLMGNNYTAANMLKGGANAGLPQELNLLPAQYVDIYTTDTFPCRVVKYGVGIWPGTFFTMEELMHEKTWNPDWRVNGAQMYGVPPLRASLKRIQNGNSSLDTQTNAFANEGIKGFAHLKATPGAVGDGEALIAEVKDLADRVRGNEWRGTENRGRIAVGGYDMGWLPVGLSSEEMEIIESQKWTLRMLCNPFGVPSQLLNDDQKAYNNFEEAEKSLTMRACLPRLIRKRDAFTRQANRDWGLDKRYVIDFDMSVYGELQAEVKETADWTTKLFAISPNEQRELCGLAALPDPEMSQPWVNSVGRVPLADFQATPVDNDLNGGFDDES